MYTIHIQYALLPNATLPLISLRQNDKKNKLCALNFSLSFMTFIKNNGFYMKILWYILKFPEISGELSGELQPAKKFSSPTPAKSDFLLSAEISGDLLETEISTTLYIIISYINSRVFNGGNFKNYINISLPPPGVACGGWGGAK